MAPANSKLDHLYVHPIEMVEYQLAVAGFVTMLSVTLQCLVESLHRKLKTLSNDILHLQCVHQSLQGKLLCKTWPGYNIPGHVSLSLYRVNLE